MAVDPNALDEQRLRRLVEAGRGLVAELDLDVVLDRLLAIARELTGARYAAIGVLDESRRVLADFVTVGIDEDDRRAIGPLPEGRGVLGLLISEPSPLRLANVAEHPLSYGFPPGHPPMETFLGVPIVLRGQIWGNLYLTEKDTGQSFDDADEATAVILADWAAIAVQNARLYRSSEQRRAELERSVRALLTTTDIARALGGETDIDRVLELIAKRSRALVEARGLAILLGHGSELTIAVTAGEIDPDLRGTRIPTDQSVAGRVLRSGKAETIDDLPSAMRFVLGGMGVAARCGLFVPLVYRGRALGVIEAFDRFDGPEFRADDERLLQAAAATAATAVATAQSVERDRLNRSVQAADEERGRWARELHDETLQGLGALRVKLSAARRKDDAETLRHAVDETIDQLTSEIAGLRSLIAELRPAALDELGLEPALTALAERITVTTGLAVSTRLELGAAQGAPERYPPEIETGVYRLVQEALTNVAKHARAEHVEIEVLAGAGGIEVTVRDDGVGFDPAQPTDGFGVTGMRERVALADGRLEITSSPEGTVVRGVLPRPAERERESA